MPSRASCVVNISNVFDSVECYLSNIPQLLESQSIVSIMDMSVAYLLGLDTTPTLRRLLEIYTSDYELATDVILAFVRGGLTAYGLMGQDVYEYLLLENGDLAVKYLTYETEEDLLAEGYTPTPSSIFTEYVSVDELDDFGN